MCEGGCLCMHVKGYACTRVVLVPIASNVQGCEDVYELAHETLASSQARLHTHTVNT